MPDAQAGNSETPDATLLLRRFVAGDSGAAEDLLPMVYQELRARAGAYFRGQPAHHTLQPTALVNEVYVRMVKSPGEGLRDRAHFFAVAATAMRQVLANHARRRALAHNARADHAAIATALVTPFEESAVDVLALDEALGRLAKFEPRHVRMVELRFFAGMSVEDVAEVLDVSTSTVERDWRRVRAWLLREMRDENAP